MFGVYFYWLSFMYSMFYVHVTLCRNQGHRYRPETTMHCTFVTPYIELLSELTHKLAILHTKLYFPSTISILFNGKSCFKEYEIRLLGLLLSKLNIHSLKINKFQLLTLLKNCLEILHTNNN